MAVVTLKSSAITSRDTPELANANIMDGKMRGFVGKCALSNGDSANSILIFASVPSNARIHELKLSAPDIGTTTTMDLGLYRTTADGGAVVDVDFFGSAISLKDGAINASDVTHEAAGAFALDDSEKMIWEALGLSADPGIMYDIAGTLVGAADAAGDVVLKGQYAI